MWGYELGDLNIQFERGGTSKILGRLVALQELVSIIGDRHKVR